MLVLSRYRDESIFIGDDIKVTVVDIRGDRVRIGIQAPPNVTVHRQEVYEAIANNQERGEKPVRSECPKSIAEEPQRFSSPLRGEIDARKMKPIVVEIDAKELGFSGIAEIVSK
jgi:carbon storage regulator